MGTVTPTLVLYLIAGVAVAVAVYLSGDDQRPSQGLPSLILAVPLWPFFVPILLAGRSTPHGQSSPQSKRTAGDPLSASIDQVQTELDVALKTLGGWAPDVAEKHVGSVGLCGEAWATRYGDLEEMDRILSTLEASLPSAYSTNITPDSSHLSRDPADLVKPRQEARRHNIQTLRELRGRAYEQLVDSLLRVRELISTIHLLRFTGASASRADELVCAIEGIAKALAGGSTPNTAGMWRRILKSPIVKELSELTWKESNAGAGDNTSSLE
jgi:hypothetical protein